MSYTESVIVAAPLGSSDPATLSHNFLVLTIDELLKPGDFPEQMLMKR
jgi:hypothetical protein